MKPLQIMIVVLFLFKRYNLVECTTYETFADNNCGIMCIKEIQTRKIYNI